MAPDIDGSKVVWAPRWTIRRTLGLLQYFKDREVLAACRPTFCPSMCPPIPHARRKTQVRPEIPGAAVKCEPNQEMNTVLVTGWRRFLWRHPHREDCCGDGARVVSIDLQERRPGCMRGLNRFRGDIRNRQLMEKDFTRRETFGFAWS